MSLQTAREVAIGRELALFARAQRLPISFPGYDFDPAARVPGTGDAEKDGPDDNLFFSIAALRVPPDHRGYNGWAVRDFIQQVDVNVRDGLGDIPALARAEALCLAFPHGHRVFAGAEVHTVIETPDVGPSLVDDTWRKIPVSITFRTIG